MPFKYAPYWIVGLLALTVLGFWPGYFSVLATAPWGFHLHGISATVWLILLAVQSWSAQARRFDLHRGFGLASLAVFPVFFAGTFAVEWSMAHATATGDLFYVIYGARLATMDLTASALLGYLYYMALAERRKVQLHARWLLATPLPLISPIVGRVLNHVVPGLVMHGPQDFPLFAWGVRWSSGIALVLTVWLYRTGPRHGKPFVVAGAVIAGQMILFDTLGLSPAWDTAYRALAQMPAFAMIGSALVVGAGIAWLGWNAGARPVRRGMPSIG